MFSHCVLPDVPSKRWETFPPAHITCHMSHPSTLLWEPNMQQCITDTMKYVIQYRTTPSAGIRHSAVVAALLLSVWDIPG